MTTTAVTTAAGPILAIDLGKYMSVACVYRSADDHRFTTVPTSRAELTRLIAAHRPAVVPWKARQGFRGRPISPPLACPML